MILAAIAECVNILHGCFKRKRQRAVARAAFYAAAKSKRTQGTAIKSGSQAISSIDLPLSSAIDAHMGPAGNSSNSCSGNVLI